MEIIRIPVTDQKKEGLLKFALPRQCVPPDCTPEFYPTDTVDAPAAAAVETPPAPPPPPVANDAVAALDEVLAMLGNVRVDVRVTGDDVRYAHFNVRRTSGDLTRMDWPLRRAEQDTARVDSSREGRDLDFILWSTRNSLRDSDLSVQRAAADTSRVGAGLNNASERLSRLTSELSRDPQKYADVLPVLSQAASFLQRATESGGGLRDHLSSGSGKIDDAEGALIFVDQYISDIKFDRPGVDVSPSARELRISVDQADRKLGDAGEQLGWSSSDLTRVDTATLTAQDLLRQARGQLLFADFSP